MLNKINQFFTLLFDDSAANSKQVLPIEVACAVLLCEVMRADNVYTDQEQQKLTEILNDKFNLTADEVTTVLAQAIELSENASDFYQFTSRLNQHYSLNERINIVTLLWQIAYADGELDSIEEHIIRKIADLLHLRHSEYIATKIAADSLKNQVS